MKDIINDYDLFIFDLDDTLAKTEKYHYQAWLNTLRNNVDTNFFFDYNTFCSIFHSNKEDNIKNYLRNDLHIENIENIRNEKTKNYLRLSL